MWVLATLQMVAGGVADASAELIKPHAEEGQLSDLTGVRCGVDISGILVKAVLARGAAFHRGEEEQGHFKQIYTYVVRLVGCIGAAAMVIVFDGARFPPKGKTHDKRAREAMLHEAKAREYDDLADAAVAAGDRLADARAYRQLASKEWNQVLSRSALRDAKDFAIDLCLCRGMEWHGAACGHRGAIGRSCCTDMSCGFLCCISAWSHAIC